MADSTSVGVLSNIFTAPSIAFAAIKERPNPWLPLLVIIIGNAIVSFAYMQSVDLAWLIDQQMQAAGNLTDEQRAQAVDAATSVSPLVYAAATSVSAGIIILAIMSLVALYYTGVSFATNDGVKFRQWLALIAWCSLPVVIGQVASLVNLQVMDARFLAQDALNPLSFGNLLAIDMEGATIVERILLSLDVSTLWATVLQIFGYQAFTGRSIGRAAIIVLGPLAVIVLISAFASLS